MNEEEMNELVERSAKRASELVLDAIDGKIAEMVLNQVYQQIGRSVVRKALWTIGIGVTVLLAWLAAKFGVKQ